MPTVNNKNSEKQYRNVTVHFNADTSTYFEGPVSELLDDPNGTVSFNCPDLMDKTRLRRIVVHYRNFLYMERGPVIEALRR
ncbi:hypothetical protein DSS3PM1_00038 [Bacteriophage DSS3_PM1]|nr:hypothetical protein DSS3PM1_00038 [Bacteriophage DSS3_PM1]